MTHRVKEPDIWGLEPFGKPFSLEDFERRVAERTRSMRPESIMSHLREALGLLEEDPEHAKALAAEDVLWYLVAYLQHFNISLKDLT